MCVLRRRGCGVKSRWCLGLGKHIQVRYQCVLLTPAVSSDAGPHS